ncbi:hypothetical protein ABH920_003601 [Catenulispora sp. EB89]|uniref:hypothetical protein n=1 Tax=Catenulispora sp. EB89 TaxID=3156257 RepID=UPI003517BA8C
MSGLFQRRRPVWLGLTAEPERELPEAVAALRMRGLRSAAPPADRARLFSVAAERRRIGDLLVHGGQRSWLRYLQEVTALVRAAAEAAQTAQTAGGPADAAPALLAAEVVLDHHTMLIGLPGPAYRRAATQRTALTEAVRVLRGLAG